MVGNWQGDRVQVGSLPPSGVDFTLAAGSRVDCGGQMRVGAMVLPGVLLHQSKKAGTVQRCCMNVPN